MAPSVLLQPPRVQEGSGHQLRDYELVHRTGAGEKAHGIAVKVKYAWSSWDRMNKHDVFINNLFLNRIAHAICIFFT